MLCIRLANINSINIKRAQVVKSNFSCLENRKAPQEFIIYYRMAVLSKENLSVALFPAVRIKIDKRLAFGLCWKKKALKTESHISLITTYQKGELFK